MAKVPAGKPNKQQCAFVRAHVMQKLLRAGWSEPEAEKMVFLVSDQEIMDMLPVQKMQGFGDGKWLKLLEEWGPKILSVVDKIANLLALFGGKMESKKASDEGAPDEEEEDEEEEDEEEEDEEEEDEE